MEKLLRITLSFVFMIGFLAVLVVSPAAHSMLAAEVEPGIIELNTTETHGFFITDYAEKKIKGKSWVYFCVRTERVSKSAKCFYGQKEQFRDVRLGLALNGLQYSLKNRIVNTKGHIPVQRSGYFYRVLIVRPQT